MFVECTSLFLSLLVESTSFFLFLARKRLIDSTLGCSIGGEKILTVHIFSILLVFTVPLDPSLPLHSTLYSATLPSILPLYSTLRFTLPLYSTPPLYSTLPHYSTLYSATLLSTLPLHSTPPL